MVSVNQEPQAAAGPLRLQLDWKSPPTSDLAAVLTRHHAAVTVTQSPVLSRCGKLLKGVRGCRCARTDAAGGCSHAEHGDHAQRKPLVLTTRVPGHAFITLHLSLLF